MEGSRVSSHTTFVPGTNQKTSRRPLWSERLISHITIIISLWSKPQNPTPEPHHPPAAPQARWSPVGYRWFQSSYALASAGLQSLTPKSGPRQRHPNLARGPDIQPLCFSIARYRRRTDLRYPEDWVWNFQGCLHLPGCYIQYIQYSTYIQPWLVRLVVPKADLHENEHCQTTSLQRLCASVVLIYPSLHTLPQLLPI